MYYLNIYLIYELENGNKKFYTKYINGCSLYGRVILEPIEMALFYFFYFETIDYRNLLKDCMEWN